MLVISACALCVCVCALLCAALHRARSAAPWPRLSATSDRSSSAHRGAQRDRGIERARSLSSDAALVARVCAAGGSLSIAFSNGHPTRRSHSEWCSDPCTHRNRSQNRALLLALLRERRRRIPRRILSMAVRAVGDAEACTSADAAGGGGGWRSTLLPSRSLGRLSRAARASRADESLPTCARIRSSDRGGRRSQRSMEFAPAPKFLRFETEATLERRDAYESSATGLVVTVPQNSFRFCFCSFVAQLHSPHSFPWPARQRCWRFFSLLHAWRCTASLLVTRNFSAPKHAKSQRSLERNCSAPHLQWPTHRSNWTSFGRRRLQMSRSAHHWETHCLLCSESVLAGGSCLAGAALTLLLFGAS